MSTSQQINIILIETFHYYEKETVKYLAEQMDHKPHP